MHERGKGQQREPRTRRTCVTPDAKILLDDGVSQITVNQLEKRLPRVMVTSFDGTRGYFFPCRVKYCRREDAHANDKRVIFIQTISGRSVKVTDDHLFHAFGKRWIPAGTLQKGDRISTYPTLDPLEQHPFQPSLKTTASRNSLRNPISFLRKLREPILLRIDDVVPLIDRRFNNHFTTFFRKNFPLSLDHHLLPTWARLLGFLLTKVRFNSDLILTFQNEKDWMRVQTDFQRLGTRVQSTRKDGLNIILIESVLLDLFKLLMMPPRFPDSSNEPFKWMLKSPATVIREFLAGLLGANGKAPWMDQPLTGNETLSFSGLKIHFEDPLLNLHSRGILSVIQQSFETLGINVEIQQDSHLIEERSPDRELTTWHLTIPNDDVNAISLLTRYIGFRYNHVESIKSDFIAEYFRFLEFVNNLDGKYVPELKSSHFPSVRLLNDKHDNRLQSDDSGKHSTITDETATNAGGDHETSTKKHLSTTNQSPRRPSNADLDQQSNSQPQPTPSTMISEEEMLEIDGDLFVWQVESQTITSFQDFLYACRADFETGLLHEPIVLLGDVLDRDVRRITVSSHTRVYIVNGFLSR